MARGSLAFQLWILCLLFFYHARCFNLPGLASQDFQTGDPLNVKVNKLRSTKTPLPYSYYSLPYCRPENIVGSRENLEEVLHDYLNLNSSYEFKMREPQICSVVCRVILNATTAKEFKEKIDDEYRVNMILDDLPLVVPMPRPDQENFIVYQLGFHVGFRGQFSGNKDEKLFINNHLAFTVKYHKDPKTESTRIVGFEVRPFSVRHEYEVEWSMKTRLTTCDPHTKRTVTSSESPQEVEDKKEIIFTYDVEFQETDVKWVTRWDTDLLMLMVDTKFHWFSVAHSLMFVLFLSIMMAFIVYRIIYRHISEYNLLEAQGDAQEETGWKLVRADVFRPPTNSDILCVYVGTGVQFVGMILVTLVFAVLGFLSPFNRGRLMTAMLLLWGFMGVFAGYFSARLYKIFKGTEWKKISVKTALTFPATAFAIFFLNAHIWGEKSSGAVPFGTMFALVFLWFGISFPLIFVGAYVGFKKPAIENPVKSSKIPRQVPLRARYLYSPFSILIGGIIPFAVVFYELFLILTSIWLHHFYYIFGLLFIIFIMLIITCAEVTILLCFLLLCREDYLWWWRSYLTSGSSALYLFLFAAYHFLTKLHNMKPSGALYFGYMLIASYAYFVMTGTIGFCACFWFTRRIYSSVKSD